MLSAWVVLVAAAISALPQTLVAVFGFAQLVKLNMAQNEEIRLLRKELVEAKLANVILKSAK
jgi:hypothetical protein